MFVKRVIVVKWDLGQKIRVNGFTGVVTKACEEVGIKKERIVLIGDEKEEGFENFSIMLGKKGGKRERIVKSDLAFLAYSSGTTGLPKGSSCSVFGLGF